MVIAAWFEDITKVSFLFLFFIFNIIIFIPCCSPSCVNIPGVVCLFFSTWGFSFSFRLSDAASPASASSAFAVSGSPALGGTLGVCGCWDCCRVLIHLPQMGLAGCRVIPTCLVGEFLSAMNVDFPLVRYLSLLHPLTWDDALEMTVAIGLFSGS